MKTCCLTFAAAMLLAASPMAVLSQASAPAPMAAASATPATLPGPRLLTPEQKRDNADITAAPESRTERAVTPQLTLPLGKKSAPPAPLSPGAMRNSKAPAAGGIDDAAARCDTLSGKQARLICLDHAARDAKPR